jgi:hypothetical protein
VIEKDDSAETKKSRKDPRRKLATLKGDISKNRNNN